MITQEQASKVRDIVAGFDEEKKKSFIERYTALEPDKKQIVITRLLESQASTTITPTNKDTSYLSGVSQRREQANKDIVGRGTAMSKLTEASQNMQSDSILRKGAGVLQGAGVPFSMLQAGISNPALAMQQGEFNPARLLSESAQGFTGQKLGEYGDVYRTAIPGVAGQAAGVVGGLTLDIAGPIKAIKTINKSLGSISKMSDGDLMKAGSNLTQAVDSAQKHIGGQLTEAFKDVNSIKVSNSDFVRNIAKMPKVLRDAVTEELGNLKLLEPTIENLRKIRTIVGKFKPGTFGKEERGLAENIEADKINNLYGSLKSTISNAISKSKGVKEAENLMRLEETASQVYRASDTVNKIATNPTLLMKTRTGKLAEGIEDASDVTSRTALNILKKNGPEARKYVNKVVNALENFNRVQRNIKTIKHIGSALTYGGAIGAVGGTIASRLLNRQDNSSPLNSLT